MGLLALALYYCFGFGFEFIVGFVFVAALVVISFVDLNVRIVPGMVRLLGIGLGLCFSVIGYFGYCSAILEQDVRSPIRSLTGMIVGDVFLLPTAWLYEKITGGRRHGRGRYQTPRTEMSHSTRRQISSRLFRKS